MQHWIAPGVLVVVVVVVDVVVVTGHSGSPGSPVQVQRNALHWSVTFFAQLIEGWGPHASLISSLQAVVLSHLPLWSAIAEEETKTPTPSATAAKNVTTAFLVIVEPPMAVPVRDKDFGELPRRGRRGEIREDSRTMRLFALHPYHPLPCASISPSSAIRCGFRSIVIAEIGPS
jgi:hypothetical protein